MSAHVLDQFQLVNKNTFQNLSVYSINIFLFYDDFILPFFLHKKILFFVLISSPGTSSECKLVKSFVMHFIFLLLGQTDRQTDRQFIQTYTYSTSSQHKLYNEICHVYLHTCEIKNEQISVNLTVTIEKKNILHTLIRLI